MLSPAHRPFELLKLIRDRALTHMSDLRRLDSQSYYLTDATLENMIRIGLVARTANGLLEPTPRLGRIFAGLGVSLTRLSPFTMESVIAAPIFGPPVPPIMKADVLILMPFDDGLTFVYEDHIKPLAHRLDLTIARADDFFAASTVMADVWNAIFAARVLIADCTGRNANVFYEIGIAHTLGKPVVLISQKPDDVPFDVAHIRALFYRCTPEGMATFEAQLTSTLRYELGRPRTLLDLLEARQP